MCYIIVEVRNWLNLPISSSFEHCVVHFSLAIILYVVDGLPKCWKWLFRLKLLFDTGLWGGNLRYSKLTFSYTNQKIWKVLVSFRNFKLFISLLFTKMFKYTYNILEACISIKFSKPVYEICLLVKNLFFLVRVSSWDIKYSIFCLSKIYNFSLIN